MNRRFWIGIVVLTAATFAFADQLVDTRGLPYEGAMTGYSARTVSFRATNIGREKSYPLDKIRSMKIDDFEVFNQAEDLMAKKKYKEAVEAYDKALRAAPAGKAWIKTLVADRRYLACVKAGMIDEAMTDWLKMMDADPTNKTTLALVPDTFAPQGDPANATAVKLLDAKLAQLKKDPKAENYTRELLKLKMKILEAMGEEEKATAAAEAVTQLDTSAVPADETTPGEEDATPAVPAAPAVGDLDVLSRLVESGKYDDVIEKLAPKIETLPRNDLAAPLFLLAKAQWLKYQAEEPKDKKLLLRAGLNLMWVYSAFGGSDEAPEALYLTAEVHKAMNDPSAARRALEELIEQFGGAEDNPWVSKAQEMLENDDKTE